MLDNVASSLVGALGSLVGASISLVQESLSLVSVGGALCMIVVHGYAAHGSSQMIMMMMIYLHP